MKNGKVSMTSFAGAGEIGASHHLYKFPNPHSPKGCTNILIDTGAYPNASWDRQPHIREEIDAICYTHTHYDHIGMGVRVWLDNMDAPVFATAPTKDFGKIQWEDTAQSMIRDARDPHQAFSKPLYDWSDIKMHLRHITCIEEWRRYELPGGVTMRPIPCGHHLGAVSFLVEWNGKSFYHTGDYSKRDQRLVGGAPQLRFRKRPVAVIGDGTYIGERFHDRASQEEECITKVKETLARGGKVLFAAFKFQRAQEIWAFLLENGISPDLIYIDGRAEEPFEIFHKYTSITMPRGSHFIRTYWQRSSLIGRSGPAVIIAHGGMLPEGSPAYKWLWSILPYENNLFVKNGYADPCTIGGALFTQFKRETDTVDIDGTQIELRCQFHEINFSAHDDWEDTQETLSLAEEAQIVVHTPRGRSRAWQKKNPSSHILIPQNGEEVGLW